MSNDPIKDREEYGKIMEHNQTVLTEDLIRRKKSKYQDWICLKCGHLVVSKEKPEPIRCLRWDDGHVCYFTLEG